MHTYRDTRRRSTDPIQIDFRLIRERETGILAAQKARNTLKTYASSWRCFASWCAAARLQPLPASPETVCHYVTWCVLDGFRLWTVRTRINAIQHHHRAAGLPSPCGESVREFVRCAQRQLRETPLGKAALSYELLCRLAAAFGETPVEVRNRAMLLLDFASGWRRSEIVALQFSDVRFCEQGVELFQRSSKTDQMAKGRTVGIQAGERPLTCPVRAVRQWIEIRGDWEGALFCRFDSRQRLTRQPFESRGNVLYKSLKRSLARVGEDPRPFGAHSLRAGMITTSAQNGAELPAIMHRTGHKRAETVLSYIRPTHSFAFNPLAGVL